MKLDMQDRTKQFKFINHFDQTTWPHLIMNHIKNQSKEPKTRNLPLNQLIQKELKENQNFESHELVSNQFIPWNYQKQVERSQIEALILSIPTNVTCKTENHSSQLIPEWTMKEKIRKNVNF